MQIILSENIGACYGVKRALELADETIKNVAKPGLEESFYWRALAKLSLGDQDGAIDDLRESLVWHEGFIPSVNQLATLGLTP